MKNDENSFDIPPKEAIKILNAVTHIVNMLHGQGYMQASYFLGILTESLAAISRQDDETKSP